MTHDPLCPPMNKHHIYCPVWDFDNECDDCCRCDLIAQVLSDERINSLGTRVRELKPYAKGDAMTHDPLCPQQPRSDGATLTMLDGTPIYCACDLIAKAREDERDGIQAVRLRTLFNEQGYRDGQRDMLAKCITVVEEIIPDDSDNGSWEATIAAAWLRHAVSKMRALEDK